jgi:membrane protease YdiL (CAAX protease family)
MKRKYIIITSLLAFMLLYVIEQILLTNYFIKTLSKLLLFTLIPYVYIKYIKKSNLKESIVHPNDKKNLKLGIILGLISFFIVLITYYLLRNRIDLQTISYEMQTKSKITPMNFIFVSLYVTLGNSFLEEFFFRGFIFLNLYELRYEKQAYIYSSILFGIYHIAIFKTWFNLPLTCLALFGLIVIGFIFCWLDTKSKNFINSWIVHILADSAIILIGFKMFDMI